MVIRLQAPKSLKKGQLTCVTFNLHDYQSYITLICYRMFLAVGCVWVFLTLGLQALYVWAFDFPKLAIFEIYGYAQQIIMLVIDTSKIACSGTDSVGCFFHLS